MDKEPTLTAKEVNKLWLDVLEAREEISDYLARAEDAREQLSIAIDKLKTVAPDIEQLIEERLGGLHSSHDKPVQEEKAEKSQLTEPQLESVLKQLKDRFKQGDVMKALTPLNGSIKQFLTFWEDRAKIQFVSGKGNGRIFKKL